MAGDFCQTNRLDSLIKERKFSEFLDNIKPIVDSSQYSIVNFEFPIVQKQTKARPIPKCGPNLKGTVEAVEAIKYSGFKCCTLANNHILDQGESCALETALLLRENGIDVAGFGKNRAEAKRTLYKEIDRQTLAIINCCEHEFSIATASTAGSNELNPVAQYNAIREAKLKADYVLVIVHGGHEHFQLPSPRMVETYRFFIDAGADAVVNHHQHCYSGYEIYNDKPIFYGLGNFLFDGNRAGGKLTWNEGFLLKLDFEKSCIKFELIPYTQCLETPTVVFMQEKEKQTFFEHIEALNQIISQPESLNDAVNAYYSTCAKTELLNMEPYASRLFRKLLSLRFAPSFLKGKKLLIILNRISCESLREKVLYALNNRLNNSTY